MPTGVPTNKPSTLAPAVVQTNLPSATNSPPIRTLVPVNLSGGTPAPPPSLQVSVSGVGKHETEIAIRITGDNLINNVTAGCVSVKSTSGVVLEVLRIENNTNLEAHAVIKTPENNLRTISEQMFQAELKSCAVQSGRKVVSEVATLSVPGKEKSKVEEHRDSVQDLATATALPGLLSGSPIEAGSLAVLALDCTTEYEFGLTRVLHPTAIRILDSDIIGCLVVNITLAISCIVLAIILSRLVSSLTSYNIYCVQGFFALPAAPLYLSFFLLTGGVFSTFYSIQNGRFSWFPVCALNVLFFMGIAPAVIWKVSSVANAKSNYTFDHKKYPFHGVVMFFLGTHEWVDTSPANPVAYLDRYGLLYNRFTDKAPYGLLLKYVLACLLAAASAITSPSMIVCGHIRVTMCLFTIAYTTILIKKKPYRRVKDQVAELILAGFKTTALLLAAVGFYSEDRDHVAFSISLTVLQVAMVVFVIKVVVDLIAFLVVLITGREARIRDASIHEECIGRLDGMEELLSETTPPKSTPMTPITPYHVNGIVSPPLPAVFGNSSMSLFPVGGLPPIGKRSESRSSRRSSMASGSPNINRRRASSPLPDVRVPISPLSDKRRRSSPLVDIVSPVQSPLTPPSRSRRYSIPKNTITRPTPTRRRSLASTPLTPFADLDVRSPTEPPVRGAFDERIPVNHKNIRVVYD